MTSGYVFNKFSIHWKLLWYPHTITIGFKSHDIVRQREQEKKKEENVIHGNRINYIPATVINHNVR